MSPVSSHNRMATTPQTHSSCLVSDDDAVTANNCIVAGDRSNRTRRFRPQTQWLSCHQCLWHPGSSCLACALNWLGPCDHPKDVSHGNASRHSLKCCRSAHAQRVEHFSGDIAPCKTSRDRPQMWSVGSQHRPHMFNSTFMPDGRAEW